MADSSGNVIRTIFREGGKGLAVFFLLVFLMMWLSGAFISKVQPGPPEKRPTPPKLTARKVERRLFPVLMEQVGNLRAMVEAQVSSRIMSQIKEILVKEGDAVQGTEEKDGKGTLMARLDDRGIQAGVQEAKSRVTAMKRAMEAADAKLGAAKSQTEAALADQEKALADYKRYQDLHEHQAATGQQLEHARARKEVSLAKPHGSQAGGTRPQNMRWRGFRPR